MMVFPDGQAGGTKEPVSVGGPDAGLDLGRGRCTLAPPVVRVVVVAYRRSCSLDGWAWQEDSTTATSSDGETRRYLVDVLDGERYVEIQNANAVGGRGNPCLCVGPRKGSGSVGVCGGGVPAADASQRALYSRTSRDCPVFLVLRAHPS